MALQLRDIAKGGSDLVGSILFFIGSIYFYPRYLIIDGGWIGTWLFLFGCVFFVLMSSIDLWDVRDTPKQSIAAMNALVNFIGSVLFFIGSFYFFPSIAEIYPSTGSYLFITGCLLFCIGAIGGIILAQREIVFSTRVIATCSCIFNFIGCVLFIIGCVFFLPEFLEKEQDYDYFLYSVHAFVVGSVSFTLAAVFHVAVIIQSGKEADEKLLMKGTSSTSDRFL